MGLYFFIHWQGLGKQTGSRYIDSTKLPVCDNYRIHNHKIFKNIAARGKTFTGCLPAAGRVLWVEITFGN
ncbi:MAG: hypothetical protein ABS67_00335 [Niabella sp. SCN 42-15]|nr:MAG: hypothetical protein ABS67_00335 [Niabella sp. SCN 42-15]